MNVFLPRFKNAENDFIMASQADRLRMSPCYKKSEMSCTTCHNPHISVTVTGKEHFNNACTSCHAGPKAVTKVVCSEDIAKRKAKGDDCSGCHMPKSGSIDIPHVNITDHYIRKSYAKPDVHLSVSQVEQVKQFIGLECLTTDKPTDVNMANGYLHFYESYSHRDYLLDSAERYVTEGEFTREKIVPAVHLYFLRNDFKKVTDYALKVPMAYVQDAWTLYRIGEAYMQQGNLKDALTYFNKAVKNNEYNLEFMNKQAAVLYGLKDVKGAKEVYHKMLLIHPKYESALASLGFIAMTENDTKTAADLLDKAIALNPDYKVALLNRAELYFYTADYKRSGDLTFRVLKMDPANEQGRQLLKKLAGKTVLN
jgi:hypothetical protein